MENKCEKNIFESSFDMDDTFLNKVDLDFRKNNERFVTKDKQKEKERNKFEIKAQYYDSSLFIDLNDSDFFELSRKEKKQCSFKAGADHDDGNKQLWNDGFISCLSPILGGKCSRRMNLSSSTPERPNELKSDVKPKEKLKDSDDIGLDAELFDDWDVEKEKEDKEGETVTLSQAMELIKEAESERHIVEETLNDSIDLLTGEIVGDDVGVMFEESFNLPKTGEKSKNKCSEGSSDCVIVEVVKTVYKPPAAQKLQFEHEKVERKGNIEEICFTSDEDFDFCTQDLLKKSKMTTKYATPELNFTKSDGASSPLKDSDLNESSDSNMKKCVKKRKSSKIIFESDTAEESPSPKFLRRSKLKTKRRKNSQENLRAEFIHSQAELSDSAEVSSDETEEDGEYDKSFVDEASYFTQNCSADMTAKYLESVKAQTARGTFKIPPTKPYIPADVFSQIPEESNSDYEIDSFCVKDVEEEPKTDLSDLEIAEKILEMDRKKKKKKRQKLRKLN